MDELNLSEIGKKLNEVFSSGNRLVFWYDTTGAFEDSVDDLKLGQVKVLHLTDRNAFRAKTTVYQILSNPVYLGKIVSQRYTTRSFKDKRIIERPESNWISVENTHEPLVDQETFDAVQERIKAKKPATWANSHNIYRGLLICERKVKCTCSRCRLSGKGIPS